MVVAEKAIRRKNGKVSRMRREGEIERKKNGEGGKKGMRKGDKEEGVWRKRGRKKVQFGERDEVRGGEVGVSVDEKCELKITYGWYVCGCIVWEE